MPSCSFLGSKPECARSLILPRVGSMFRMGAHDFCGALPEPALEQCNASTRHHSPQALNSLTDLIALETYNSPLSVGFVLALWLQTILCIKLMYEVFCSASSKNKRGYKFAQPGMAALIRNRLNNKSAPRRISNSAFHNVSLCALRYRLFQASRLDTD